MSDIKVRQRRFASKKRGGCRTCASRHVRCDGKPPLCGPCQRSSRDCLWSHQVGNQNNPPLKLVYINRQSECPILKQPQNAIKGLDGRSLAYFRHVVAPSLGGSFDAKLFNGVACQVAQSSPSIANAITALAKCWEASLGCREDDTLKRKRKLAALQHYSAAVSQARQLSLRQQNSDVIELFVCNLLFICFENLQHHYEAALQQMSSGLYLFCTWQSSKGLPNLKHATTDLDEVFSHLVNSYHRLMVQSLMFLDTHRIDRHMFLPALQPEVEAVPECFSRIEQARDCLNRIVSTMVLQSISSRFDEIYDEDQDYAMARPVFRFHGTVLAQFDKAFKAFKHKRSAPNAKQELGMILVEMMQLAIRILHVVSLAQSEMAYDKHQLQFERILELGQRMLPLITHKNGPSMFIEGLPPLYLVARSCRNPVTRRRAISLLHNSDRNEGVWNGNMLACMAEKMMEIEEAGVQQGESGYDQIPASARLATQKAIIYSASRRIDVTFLRGQREPGGPEILRCSVEF